MQFAWPDYGRYIFFLSFSHAFLGIKKHAQKNELGLLNQSTYKRHNIQYDHSPRCKFFSDHSLVFAMNTENLLYVHL